MNKHNALRQAAKAGNTAIVRDLLKEGYDVNLPFVHNWRLLHFAAKGGQSGLLAMAIGVGCSVRRRQSFLRIVKGS